LSSNYTFATFLQVQNSDFKHMRKQKTHSNYEAPKISAFPISEIMPICSSPLNDYEGNNWGTY